MDNNVYEDLVRQVNSLSAWQGSTDSRLKELAQEYSDMLLKTAYTTSGLEQFRSASEDNEGGTAETSGSIATHKKALSSVAPAQSGTIASSATSLSSSSGSSRGSINVNKDEYDSMVSELFKLREYKQNMDKEIKTIYANHISMKNDRKNLMATVLVLLDRIATEEPTSNDEQIHVLIEEAKKIRGSSECSMMRQRIQDFMDRHGDEYEGK